jgi:hypothetical protein
MAPLVRETFPELVVTAQVYAASKLVMFTVKPVVVETAVSNVGLSAAPVIDEAENVALPEL